MDKQRFRQIHLDFHTSPDISGVGEAFDAREFAATLAKAHVNSVNIFAKCHHGYAYYPTKVGVMHPHLKKDLLGEMIEALHANGIRCPIYYTVVWDEYAANHHADWLQVNTEGQFIGRPPFGTQGWRYLCLNTPYLDYVADQVTEILENYEVDGFWFDIFEQHPKGCVCNHCLASMAKGGIDPQDEPQRLRHNFAVAQKALARLNQLIMAKRPQASLVFNSRMRLDNDCAVNLRSEMAYYSHFEIESLPSGEWGYLHFPMYARHCATLGKEVVGMNGRFHLSWADFGGLKNQAALEYECYRMLSLGAKCSVGDQLHPTGRLDAATYDLIGRVYEQVERKEEWCAGAGLIADIGVLINTKTPAGHWGGFPGIASDEGAAQMLIELQQQFHFIDAAADFAQYAVIIAPDGVLLDERLAGKLQAYLAGGGALLATAEARLTLDKKEFALAEIPAIYQGDSPYPVDYIRLAADMAAGARTDYSYVLYSRGTAIAAAAPADQVLATAVHPYFNRSWKSFCSHFQTPPAVATDEPLIIRRGRVIYIANPLFKAYRETGYKIYKDIIRNCLSKLLPAPLVQSNLPSTAEVTVLNQAQRQIVHVLHYIPQRRAKIDIIEDVIPLHDVRLKIRCRNTNEKPTKVYLVPEKTEIPYSVESAYVQIDIPVVTGHQMVVIEYA